MHIFPFVYLLLLGLFCIHSVGIILALLAMLLVRLTEPAGRRRWSVDYHSISSARGIGGVKVAGGDAAESRHFSGLFDNGCGVEHGVRNMAAIHRPFVRSGSRKLQQMLNVTMTTIPSVHRKKKECFCTWILIGLKMTNLKWKFSLHLLPSCIIKQKCVIVLLTFSFSVLWLTIAIQPLMLC